MNRETERDMYGKGGERERERERHTHTQILREGGERVREEEIDSLIAR